MESTFIIGGRPEKVNEDFRRNVHFYNLETENFGFFNGLQALETSVWLSFSGHSLGLVKTGGQAGVFFENYREIIGGGKSQIQRSIGNRYPFFQKALGLLDFYVVDVFPGGYAGFFLELYLKSGKGQPTAGH